jgi:hypothetical protein
MSHIVSIANQYSPRLERDPARQGNPIHHLIQQITQDALRKAALALTYQESLDIAGAALVAVAMLARMEARHA